MLNGFEICHGGYLFLLADTAFAFACNTHNRITYAASATIEFVRPAKLHDRLIAYAKESFLGGKSGVYDVDILREDGDRVAMFRGRSVSSSEQHVAPFG